MRFHPLMALLCLGAFVLVCGCGGQTEGPQPTEGEPGELEDLVFNTGANWQSKPTFDGLFAQGATLDDKERDKFKGLFIKPDNVQINGDAATISVLVGKTVDGEYSEESEVTVTWEAVKEGDAWKLTKAPLQ